MHILIVSDIHANPQALGVLPEADAVVCAGDLVDYGPDPRASIEWCRMRKATVVRGNHDLALAEDVDCGVRSAMRPASVQTRLAHRAMLDVGQLSYLRALPAVARVELGGRRFAVVHAFPNDPRRYADPSEAADALIEVAPDADVLVLGHTHVQALFQHRGRTVINPGSVGVATEGGSAHYALCDDDGLRLEAHRYDVELTIRALDALELTADAREPLIDALRNGRRSSIPHS